MQRKALDADTKGPLRDIHCRVATAILFESSGGQTDKVAHLPELRFALGEPEVDTTSVDNAAFALEDKSYFIRKVGSDGFKIGHQPTMEKVVSDRRASLDQETEIKPAIRKLVEDEEDEFEGRRGDMGKGRMAVGGEVTAGEVSAGQDGRAAGGGPARSAVPEPEVPAKLERRRRS